MTRDEVIEKMAREIWRHEPNCRGEPFETHSARKHCLDAALTALFFAERTIPGLTGLLEGTHVAVPRGAVAEIAAERKRQVTVEGWTLKHDDEHSNMEMSRAAKAYLLNAIECKTISGAHNPHLASDEQITPGHPKGEPPVGWPWAKGWWNPKSVRRDLIRAAALIVAEIERLDRAMIAAQEQP